MNSVFEGSRPRLQALAYRLLGERADAEDTVQEVWLRWQKADQSKIQTPEAWLVKVCSNACLDFLKSARCKRELYTGQWLPEPWITQETPEDNWQRRVHLGQAYVWMLSNLSPDQRVALALYEVFDWSHEEVAQVLGQTAVNSRQLVFQARRKQRSLFTPMDGVAPCDRQATEQFVQALGSGSAEQVIRTLSPDVVLRSDGGGKAFAARNPIVGATRTSNFLTTSSRKTSPEREVVWGGAEFWILCRCGGQLVTAMTLVASERGIEQIFAHRNPDKLRALVSATP